MGRQSKKERHRLVAAVEQVVRFMQQFKSPEAMFDSLGLPAPDTEEQDALPTDSEN